MHAHLSKNSTPGHAPQFAPSAKSGGSNTFHLQETPEMRVVPSIGKQKLSRGPKNRKNLAYVFCSEPGLNQKLIAFPNGFFLSHEEFLLREFPNPIRTTKKTQTKKEKQETTGSLTAKDWPDNGMNSTICLKISELMDVADVFFAAISGHEILQRRH